MSGWSPARVTDVDVSCITSPAVDGSLIERLHPSRVYRNYIELMIIVQLPLIGIARSTRYIFADEERLRSRIRPWRR